MFEIPPFLAVGVPTDRHDTVTNYYLSCMNVFHKRQGQMDVNFCYFYTDTIIDFKHLLADDTLKMIVISSLQYLVGKGLVTFMEL